MAGTRKVLAAGFNLVFYGARDENGYLIGGTTTAPTAGSQAGNPTLRLTGVRSAEISIPAAEVVISEGDDGDVIGQFQFGPSALPSGNLVTAVADLDYEALAQGTLVESVGDVVAGVLQPAGFSPQPLYHLLQRRAQSQSSGSVGGKRWQQYHLLNSTVQPQGAPFGIRGVAEYAYNIVLSSADRMVTGASFFLATHGTTAMPIYKSSSDNPMTVHRFTGNNAQTVFNLAYPAISAAKTLVYVNGVKLTPTTDYTVATTVLTFNTAPGAAVIIEVWYEVLEENIV
jgi:hypothetical protein